MKETEKLQYNFYYNKARARYLRKIETRAEKMLWTRLRNKQVAGLKFRRQHPIGYFVADFYCHEIKLIIELEGRVHDKKEQKEYDRLRKELIETWEFKVITIKNSQIYNNIDNVIKCIEKTAERRRLSLSSQEREMEGEV
jgi:very-short-patch-repair endonuclease